jgi:hypothetical protein
VAIRVSFESDPVQSAGVAENGTAAVKRVYISFFRAAIRASKNYAAPDVLQFYEPVA